MLFHVAFCYFAHPLSSLEQSHSQKQYAAGDKSIDIQIVNRLGISDDGRGTISRYGSFIHSFHFCPQGGADGLAGLRQLYNTMTDGAGGVVGWAVVSPLVRGIKCWKLGRGTPHLKEGRIVGYRANGSQQMIGCDCQPMGVREE